MKASILGASTGQLLHQREEGGACRWRLSLDLTFGLRGEDRAGGGGGEREANILALLHSGICETRL